MRNINAELIYPLECVLQPSDHSIERLCKATKFIFSSTNIYPLIKVARRYFIAALLIWSTGFRAFFAIK